jgi:hypothetical protein
MEYSIPAIPDERYTANLLARFGLDPVFAERTGAGFQRDSNIFIEFFTQLANAMALSLRARERCITRLRIVMDQTPCNHYLYPLLVALLIVLRSNNDALFRDVVSGKASGPEAVDFLASLSGGQELLSRGKQGVLIQAYFLAMISEPCDDHDLKERARWEEWAKNRGEEVGTVLDLERQIKIDRLGIPIPLPALAAKIDFVAQIR